MPNIILTQGLPGSGKSTWARQVSDNLGHQIVELDGIREMLSGRKGSQNVHADWDTARENLAIKIMLSTIKTLVRQGQNVIVSNCHMTRRLPTAIKIAAHEAGGATFNSMSFMDVPVEECIERDSKRGDNSVGEKVIRRLLKSNRGWELTAEWLNDDPAFKRWQPTAGFPWATLCDLDGTLAIHPPGWSPYDDDRIPHDLVDPTVLHHLHSALAMGDTIILLTGRQGSEKCRRLTEAWLYEHKIPHDALVMRKEGDTRSDHIVKNDLFNEFVDPLFNTRVIYEDRNRVLATWRRRGIPAFHVREGDF